MKSVAAAAEQLDDFRVSRPGPCPELDKPLAELANLLFGRLEAEICCFPRIVKAGPARGRMHETIFTARGAPRARRVEFRFH